MKNEITTTKNRLLKTVVGYISDKLLPSKIYDS